MARPTSAYPLNAPGEPDLSSINMCMYAHPGDGKTVLAGTGDIILDGDGTGAAAAASQGSKAIVVPVLSYDELRDAFEWVSEDVAPKKPDAWVSWDSLTLFQDRTLIEDVTAEAHDENPKQSEWVPSQREYLVDHNRIKMWIRRFAKLKINFMVTAHVGVAEDPEGNLIYMPAVQGKGMASAVSGYMNIVGFMAKKEGKPRKVLFQKRDQWYAKDQFDCLGVTMTDPTLPKIRAAVEKSSSARRTSSAAGKRRNTSGARRKRTTVSSTK